MNGAYDNLFVEYQKALKGEKIIIPLIIDGFDPAIIDRLPAIPYSNGKEENAVKSQGHLKAQLHEPSF